MKVRNSLRSLKNRHRDCRVVRRKGRVYVINKTQRRLRSAKPVPGDRKAVKIGGGRYWDRTSDPFDVNEVLYR